ncbi:MAG: polysaccharide biosynthesis/export family protein [Anditalea sp.]
MKSKLIYILLFIVFTSCAKRNLVYFSDVDSDADYSVEIPEMVEPQIQTDDLLRITVTSLSPESNLLFNAGVLNSGGENSMNDEMQNLNAGYLIDKNGEINFPVLGMVKLGGLTKPEAIEEMSHRLSEYVKDPIVNIRFVNFKITVIGEVNMPSTFTVPTEKINVLEALGLAGDLTPFGKRENVLIIREKNGVRSATRFNLNKKDILSSPYYYLQQNDIIYVEPDQIKAIQASTNQRSLTVLGLTSSLVISILFNLRHFL